MQMMPSQMQMMPPHMNPQMMPPLMNPQMMNPQLNPQMMNPQMMNPHMNPHMMNPQMMNPQMMLRPLHNMPPQMMKPQMMQRPPQLTNPQMVSAPATVPTAQGQAATSPRPTTTYLTAASVFLKVALQGVQVYVGRLPVDLEERLVRTIMNECGLVTKWSRAIDLSTQKFRAFGFCEFDTAAGALRCVNCLNGFVVNDSVLQVKAGTKETLLIEEARAAETPEDALIFDAACLERITAAVNLVQQSKASEAKARAQENAANNKQAADNLCSISIPIQACSSESTMPAYAEEQDKDQVLNTEIEKFRIRQKERDRELEVCDCVCV